MRQRKTAVIRSDRKTLSLQVKPDGTLVVRAPRRLPQKEIDRVLEEKSEWIERTLEKVKETNAAGEEAPLGSADIHALAEQALRELPPRVRLWAGWGRFASCATGRMNEKREAATPGWREP